MRTRGASIQSNKSIDVQTPLSLEAAADKQSRVPQQERTVPAIARRDMNGMRLGLNLARVQSAKDQTSSVVIQERKEWG